MRSHADAATLRRALERTGAAWPEGEEHMAKLSVNAMIGLWARSTEVVYSLRSSSSELGADFSQAFAYEGGTVWDFVYARRLLRNGTYRVLCQEGILSGRNFVRKEFCQEGILEGICQEGILSGRNFVRKEFCQEGILSGRNFVRKRAVPGSGLCQEEALPGSVLCQEGESALVQDRSVPQL